MTSSLLSYLDRFSKQKIDFIGPMPLVAKYEEPCIFIDAGVKHRQDNLGFSIGDGDSSMPEKMDILLSCEKEESDLEYALNALPYTYTRYNLHGFLGGRQDHEWLGIMLMHGYLKAKQVAGVASFADKILIVSNSYEEFEFEGGFSLLSLDESTQITLGGDVKYKVESQIRSMSSHGLSNHCYKKLSIKVNGQVILFKI